MATQLAPPPLQDSEFTQSWRDYFKRVRDLELVQLLELESTLPYHAQDFNLEWVNWLRELHRALQIQETSFPHQAHEWNFAWLNYNRVVYNYLKLTNIINSNTTVDTDTPLYNYIDASGGDITITFGDPVSNQEHKFIRIDDSNNTLTFSFPDTTLVYEGTQYNSITMSEQRASTIIKESDTFWILDRPSKVISGDQSQNTNWRYPTNSTQFSSGISWSNPDNIFNNDGNDASVANSSESDVNVSQGLVGNSYGFSSVLPADITIDGVEFRYEATQFGDTREETVALVDGTTVVSTNKSDDEIVDDGVSVHGGPTDLWGASSIADSFVKSSSFGVVFQVRMPASAPPPTPPTQCNVDFFQVRIYYTVNTLNIVKGDPTRREPQESVC